MYNSWDKNFSNVPLFKEPYGLNSKGITKDDLKPIVEDRKLYNGFARILRKYAVSDLTNAYNKLFNLFLCKIVDEDKLYLNQSYDIQFQWKKEDTSYDVLDRLSNLYNEGIDKYLKISVTDYSKSKFLEDIKTLSNGNKEFGAELLKEFNELRFIKNNEFAFIEVFNMETFKQNSLILREIVKLFERVKIKYSDKDQFLGDFFERLLNIGIKQTEGQFFTPIPIANFIVNSIPFEKMIEDKVNNDDAKFLPYMIDYACGAGHFITEFMHRIEPILNKYKQSDFKTKLQIQNYKQWAQNQYAWAKEFVYGIEKDYRLTKTSKIACFLNGDGDANIITGNGLDSFDSDIFENTILYENLKEGDNYSKDHNVLDCVIANPPYSVQDFKDTLKKSNEEPYGEKNFELFKSLGDSSDDIECLFMERAKQLVKENGYAAIVLANTFLTNSGIHQKTRKMILENFKIKGIVELGSGAFMATGTNTIVLFMQKRKNDELDNIKNVFNEFKSSLKDINFNGKTKIISQFIKDTYEDLDYESYVSLFNNKPNNKLKSSDFYEEYYDSIISKLEDKISKTKKETEKQKLQTKLQEYRTTIPDLSDLIDIELNKIYMYLLNDGINTVVISAGESKDDVADFLGYKFSKRKGDEGLKELTDKAIKELDSYTKRKTIDSKLYNPNVILDSDKVNYYIYNNLLKGELSEQDLDLMHKKIKKMKYYALNDLFEYDTLEFDETIGMESKKKRKYESKLPLIKLKKVENINIDKGDGAPQGKKYFEKGVYPFIRAGNLNNVDDSGYIIPDKDSYINAQAVKDYKLKLHKKGTILFPISGKSIDTNNIGILKNDAYVVNHLACIYHPNTDMQRYLFEIFSSYGMSNLKSNSSDYPTMKNTYIGRFRIPDLTLYSDARREILTQLDVLRNQKEYLRKEVKKLEEEILSHISSIKTDKLEKLGRYLSLEYGIALPETKRVTGEYPVVGSGGIVGYHNEYMLTAPNIIVGRKGSVGSVNYITDNCTPIDTTLYVKLNGSDHKLKYVYYLLKTLKLEDLNKGLGPGGVNRNKIYNIKVYLPQPKQQELILSKIEASENKLAKIKKEIDEIPAKKQAILDKYLK